MSWRNTKAVIATQLAPGEYLGYISRVATTRDDSRVLINLELEDHTPVAQLASFNMLSEGGIQAFQTLVGNLIGEVTLGEALPLLSGSKVRIVASNSEDGQYVNIQVYALNTVSTTAQAGPTKEVNNNEEALF